MNGQSRGRKAARICLAWIVALLTLGSTTAHATAIGMVFTSPNQVGQVIGFTAQETALGGYPFASEPSADTYVSLLIAGCTVPVVCDTWKGRYSYLLTDMYTGEPSILVTFNVENTVGDDDLPLFKIHFYEYAGPLDPYDSLLLDFPVAASLPRSKSAQCIRGSLYSCEFDSEFVFMRGDSWLGIVTLAQDAPEPATAVLVLVAIAALAARRARGA